MTFYALEKTKKFAWRLHFRYQIGEPSGLLDVMAMFYGCRSEA